MKSWVWFAVFFTFAAPLCAVAQEAFEFQAGEVVAFLGGTNCVNLQNDGHLEAILSLTSKSKPPIRFVDLAWEGDTVFRQGTVIERWRRDKYGDLAKQLSDHKVTTVIVMFGQMEAIHGHIDDDAEQQRFSEAFSKLMTTALGSEKTEEQTRRVIVVSPIPYERTDSLLPDLSAKNPILTEFVEAMQRLSSGPNIHFVNLLQFYKQQPPVSPLTDNGVHIRPESLEKVARDIAMHLGLDAKVAVPQDLLKEVSGKHRLWMNHWRPANWKCLFGDDGQREFGKSTAGGPTLREEWSRLPGLISESETRIHEMVETASNEVARKASKP